MVPLIHLHGIAQCAGGTGYNRNLLHRRGVGLAGRHQGVADFMVSHDPLLFICKNGVLFLIAGDYHLNAGLQILLRHRLAVIPHCPQSRFIYNIGQLRAGGSRRHPGNHGKIHIIRYFYFSGVYL